MLYQQCVCSSWLFCQTFHLWLFPSLLIIENPITWNTICGWKSSNTCLLLYSLWLLSVQSIANFNFFCLYQQILSKDIKRTWQWQKWNVASNDTYLFYGHAYCSFSWVYILSWNMRTTFMNRSAWEFFQFSLNAYNISPIGKPIISSYDNHSKFWFVGSGSDWHGMWRTWDIMHQRPDTYKWKYVLFYYVKISQVFSLVFLLIFWIIIPCVAGTEKVVGWALSHHLMQSPEADPDARLVLSCER